MCVIQNKRNFENQATVVVDQTSAFVLDTQYNMFLNVALYPLQFLDILGEEWQFANVCLQEGEPV